MEKIMDFLVENYVYVAAISGFLIIVLLGVIIAGNKNRKKAKEPDMVSISDVNTGTINDVAANLNMQNGVEPLKVNEVPSSNVNVQSNNVGEVNQFSEVQPVTNMEPAPFMNNNTMNPINNTQNNVNYVADNNVGATMNVQESSVSEPIPTPTPTYTDNSVNNVNRTDDVDIIDFSTPVSNNTGSVATPEQNPLNGSESNFNENNNQGM